MPVHFFISLYIYEQNSKKIRRKRQARALDELLEPLASRSPGLGARGPRAAAGVEEPGLAAWGHGEGTSTV